MFQLLAFVQADLHSHRPKMEDALEVREAESSTFGMYNSFEPQFPKSLYLIQPLFTSYDLNPVAPTAQASVPVPQGLDLDTWIVSPPRDALEDDPSLTEETVEDEGCRRGVRVGE